LIRRNQKRKSKETSSLSAATAVLVVKRQVTVPITEKETENSL